MSKEFGIEKSEERSMKSREITLSDVFVSQDGDKWYVQNHIQMLNGEYIASFEIEKQADEYAHLLNKNRKERSMVNSI